jgi:hypothetical protein
MFIGRASKPAIVTARHELFHNLVRNKNDAALEIVRRFNIANRAAREFQRTMSRRYTDRGRAAPSMELTAEEAAAEVFSHTGMRFRDTFGQTRRLIDAFDDADDVSRMVEAMHGAVAAGKAAGGYDSIVEAAQHMARLRDELYTPNPEAKAIYDRLYSEYVTLHDYFGRGANDAMKRLKALKAEVLRK